MNFLFYSWEKRCVLY